MQKGEVWFVEFPLEEDPSITINRPVIVLDEFWSQSFCLLTTGGATVDIIKQYIQSQGMKNDK